MGGKLISLEDFFLSVMSLPYFFMELLKSSFFFFSNLGTSETLIEQIPFLVSFNSI